MLDLKTQRNERRACSRACYVHLSRFDATPYVHHSMNWCLIIVKQCTLRARLCMAASPRAGRQPSEHQGSNVCAWHRDGPHAVFCLWLCGNTRKKRCVLPDPILCREKKQLGCGTAESRSRVTTGQLVRLCVYRRRAFAHNVAYYHYTTMPAATLGHEGIYHIL